jgi:hypothetical protein
MSGDLFSKLKNINKDSNTDEISLAQDIFGVNINTIKTNNKFINSKSFILSSIVILSFFIFNLPFITKLFHKYISNPNYIKLLTLLIVFIITYFSSHYIFKSDML